MCTCKVHILYTAKHTCTYIHMGILFRYNSEPPDPWTSDLTDVSVALFREEVGPTMPLAPTTYVLALFQMFFTMTLMGVIVKQTLMGVIVEQTNIYARHILGESRAWREVTADELWAFSGFCILMGINHLPAIHHYWSSDPNFTTSWWQDTSLKIGSSLYGGSSISPTMVRSHHLTMVRSHHPHQIVSGRSAL